MRTEDLQPTGPPMSIPDMLIEGAVFVEVDIGLSVVFVAMTVATDVVITSVVMMVLCVG